MPRKLPPATATGSGAVPSSHANALGSVRRFAVMDHDRHYKRIFSSARMMRSFLETFLPDHARRIDLGTLDPLPASFAGRVRSEGDMIWRARTVDESARTVLIPLEFQSRSDPAMPLRMEVYAAHCLREAMERDWGKPAHRLRVLPVVLHNGRRRWTAPTARRPVWTADNDGEPGPRSYYVVDLAVAGGYDRKHAWGLAAALGEVERAETGERLNAALGMLARALEEAGDADLRRRFSAWLLDLLEDRKFPRKRIENMDILTEERPMLAETLKEWTDGWFQEGLERGMEQQKALIRRLAARKFSANAAAKLVRRLESAADAEQLQTVGEWTVDCDTDEELLLRLEERET